VIALRTLVISGYGIKLGVKKGCIVIKDRDKTREVSPSDLDQIIIATSGVLMSSKFLRLLTNYGVDLVVLDSRGYPISRFYHPYITKTIDSRLAQYLSYLNGLAKEVAKVIAYCKLMNQASYLLRLSRSLGANELKESAYAIESLANEILRVNSEDLHALRKDLINIEAHGARIYWSSITYVLPNDLGFKGRDQDGNDLVNISLNYGYGLIYSECWKAAVLAGLDPYAGFLHTERSGRPVLTYDLIEMFRAVAVDSVIISMARSGWRGEIKGGLLSHKSRAEIIKAISENLEKRFRSKRSESHMTLRQWIRHSALDIANSLIGCRKPKGFIVRW